MQNLQRPARRVFGNLKQFCLKTAGIDRFHFLIGSSATILSSRESLQQQRVAFPGTAEIFVNIKLAVFKYLKENRLTSKIYIYRERYFHRGIIFSSNRVQILISCLNSKESICAGHSAKWKPDPWTRGETLRLIEKLPAKRYNRGWWEFQYKRNFETNISGKRWTKVGGRSIKFTLE